MKNPISYDSSVLAPCAILGLMLISVSACGTYVDDRDGGGNSSVSVQDTYVYYPEYEVYYNSSQGGYYYQDHGEWARRSDPPGVSVSTLRDSRSVQMSFHDAPANHHAIVVKQYPRSAPTHRPAPEREADRR
jgi:hypothetical protein